MIEILPEQDKPLIAISPDGKYLVTYNGKDKEFIGWNVGKNEGGIRVGKYVVENENENMQDELEDYEKDNDYIQVGRKRRAK